MLFTRDRRKIREFYAEAWKKRLSRAPLEPMEELITDIIAQHPEYHGILEAGETHLDKDYLPEMGESNPFLHMSLHVAIQEQLSTNRPKALRQIHHQLAAQLGDTHEAEHLIAECLAEMIWAGQRSGRPFNEKQYVKQLRKLLHATQG
ncbi:MAG TPA: DUF1841 family protein [Gammaproteobacteria bacterium]|nr:DUF1841 family protein [Gammaproteobacteria bacterium]